MKDVIVSFSFITFFIAICLFIVKVSLHIILLKKRDETDNNKWFISSFIIYYFKAGFFFLFPDTTKERDSNIEILRRKLNKFLWAGYVALLICLILVITIQYL